MDKKKVTAYISDDLNTQMWTHINQASAGSSTYGAVSNFVTSAVTHYLADAPQEQITFKEYLDETPQRRAEIAEYPENLRKIYKSIEGTEEDEDV